MKAQAAEFLANRWEELSPQERKEQLQRLCLQVEEWQAQSTWVETHLEALDAESLASGETQWTDGPDRTGNT
jgi:hypothetical protein